MVQASRPAVAWLPTSWTLALLSAALCITTFIGRHVPENYMDEPFHVPMTQQYCRGNLLSWDPKITTFPGLYVIGAAYAWATRLLFCWTGIDLAVTCSGPYLRSVNALMAVACIQLAYAISVELQRSRHSSSSNSSSNTRSAADQQQRQQQQGHQQQQLQEQQAAAAGVALMLGLLPTQLFFAFLFYTDVPSLLVLLVTELLLLRGATHAAAAAGAAAIGMRQTNAVWVTFLTGAAMLHELLLAVDMQVPAATRRTKELCQQHQQQRQQLQQQSNHTDDPSEMLQSGVMPSELQLKQEKLQRQQQRLHSKHLICLLTAAWKQKQQLLADFWPLLLLPAAFCAFVAWNGSITLGDKEAHAPSLHLMQPLYFGLFCLVNAGPVLLQPSILGPVLDHFRSRRLTWVAGLVIAAVAGCWVVARYSLAHPYLLADNRHYTFYLWRKVLTRHWLVRYCLVPAYIVSWVLLLAGLSVTQHWLWVAAYVLCCFVTLVPAWLLEFRYFTTPFALAILHLPAPSRSLSLLVAAAYCCVNAVTLYIFAKRPYTWGDGSIARFMW